MVVDYALLVSTHDPPSFDLLDKLTVHIYEMSQEARLISVHCFISLINNQQQMWADLCSETGRGAYPGTKTVCIAVTFYGYIFLNDVNT